MLIKGEEKYIGPLSDLWHRVFGDSYEYIGLFFQVVFPLCETFVKECDGQVVSALYLLSGNIDFDGRAYKGRYLYAAATEPEYRGKGLMTELIKEARVYCEKEKTDFICLVPADDGLYNYYSKFGFQAAMYRYETKAYDFAHDANFIAKKIDNYEEFEKLRSQLVNKFIFENKIMKYVYGSMKNEGCEFYENITDGYFICDDNTVYEFITEDAGFDSNVKNMLSCFCGEAIIYSPCSLGEYGESRAVPFGMIYPINAELKRDWKFTDIYMNLALN